MIKYLRVLVFLSVLAPLASHALSTTIVTKVSSTQLTLPKTQIVVPQTVAPSKVVVPVTPPTQTIVDSIVPTSQIVAPQTPPTPLPQAPTNPPPMVSQTTIPRTTLSTETRTVLTQTQPRSTTDKLDIDFRTGGDNLEPKPFQENLEIHININGKSPIIVTNANNGQTWPNNSVRRVTIPLDGTIKLEDIQSITLKRLRSNDNYVRYVWEVGEKDNWNLDKLTVTASIKINGRNQRTTLANVVPPAQGQPVFRFTYDNSQNQNEGRTFTWVFSLPRATGNSTPSTTPTNARI